MPRLLMVAILTAALTSHAAALQTDAETDVLSCTGLPISHFESRFPTKVKRITFADTMLDTFVELWQAGSRPDLPKRPERVIIYALPGLPLIIGYQEQHCIIAYLAVDSAVLWQWLHSRLGWTV